MKENIIKGIMTDILETKGKKSAFKVFLEGDNIDLKLLSGGGEIEQIRNQVFTKYLNAKSEYKSIVDNKDNITLFNRMKELETLIVQSRSIINTVTKLSMINQNRGGSETSYIIARAPFFNPDNVKAEIRVYLGKTEEIGRSIEELSKDHKFMDDAERQIVNAMKEVMEKSKVEVAIKKSVSVKQLVTNDGDNEGEVAVKPKNVLREDPRLSPYRPGPGPNPKPKHYGIFIPTKKK
jgi:hypothetical protein